MSNLFVPDAVRIADALRELRCKRLMTIGVIPSDGGSPKCKTFDMATECHAASRWVVTHNVNNGNLYWEVGVPREKLNRKSREADIVACDYVSVDCDPRKDESADDAKRRIRAKLRSGVVPPPSIVYESGNGIVALWRRMTPVLLKTRADRDRCKAQNRAMARALGGKVDGFDHCQSLDHFFRVPFTINFPGAKKRALGRKVTFAGNFEATGKCYSESAFPVSNEVTAMAEDNATKLGTIGKVDIGDLPLNDATKEIIRLGKIEGEEKEADDSPSAWRFDALRRMIRAGVTLEQTVAVFSDARNGVLVESLIAKRNGNLASVQRLIAKEYQKMNAIITRGDQDAFDDHPTDENDWAGADTATKTKSRKTNPYAGVSLAAILAMKPPQWTLDGIIPKGSFFEVFGREKAGKTFWSLHLALCVATNTKCFGRRVSPGRVLYIIAEGNRRLFANRVLAWIIGQAGDDTKRAKELRAAIDEHFRIVPIPVYMNRAKDAKALLEANPGSWSMVVVDTLFRNMDGDPNGSQDMSQFVKGIDFVRTGLKATMLLLHHPGHSNTERSQGSSALAAAIDGRVRFFIGKDGKRRVWQVMFLRDGAVPSKPTVFDLVSVVLEVGGQDFDFDDPDGNDEDLRKPDVTSAYLSLVEGADEADIVGGELTDEDRLLIRIIKERPASQKALTNDTWKRSKVSRCVAALVMNGWLDNGTLAPTKKGIDYARTLRNEGDEEEDFDFG